ncbi:hypothetical protein NSMS1_56530 [Nostoc sp. MS1]|nr:hypothetical protein NSMS1_56530 [Nostoc sp. MS1]
MKQILMLTPNTKRTSVLNLAQDIREGLIPFHKKDDMDANPQTYAKYHFLNFEF